MIPIKSRRILNFIHWVAIHKKEINSLRDLTRENLLGLASEFEGKDISKDEILNMEWEHGFFFLLETSEHEEGYDQARRELMTSGLG